MRVWLMMASITACLTLAACGLGEVAPSPKQLDLGTSVVGKPATEQVEPIVLPNLAAASGLYERQVIWRMGPTGSPNSYATYVWAAAPSVLVHERLFERLSLQGPVLPQDINAEMAQLRVTLMQFEQIYAPDGTGNEAVVTLQAVLVKAGKVLGQRLVTERQAGRANTAPAGAEALRIATDKAVDQLVQWTIEQLN